MAHDHAHPHSHAHDHARAGTRAFAWVALINLGYTVLEGAYGFHINSLALLSDALHNLGDVLGLLMAWGAAALAQRPATSRHTYGWRRATLLSPLANALLLMVLCGALGWEAVRRFGDPPPVPGVPVIAMASLGIAINLGSAWLLRAGHAHDLNRRGAFLHLMADAAVSGAAVLAGVGMLVFGWSWLDPLTALLVAVVVAISSARLLRDSFNATMDAVPAGIEPDQVTQFLSALPGVCGVHHLHIWQVGTGQIALTAHLLLADTQVHHGLLEDARQALDQRFGINHATLQIEHGPGCGQQQHDAARHQPL